MRAVVYTGAGGNEVVRLEERPDPVPGSNDVLVRVRSRASTRRTSCSAKDATPHLPGARRTSPG